MGLVLAGGRSTRMGENKAFLKPWGNLGPTLLGHAWNIVTGLTPLAYVSCVSAKTYPEFPCLEDRYSIPGPLAGLLTGLEYAKKKGFEAIITLACDLPAMKREILARLARCHQSAERPFLATFYESGIDGTIEILTGIYDCSAISALETGARRGEASIYQLLHGRRIQRIVYGKDMANAFINCNCPEDLAAIPPDWHI